MDEKFLPELETRPLRLSHVPGTGNHVVNAPDGTTLILSTDDISGGLRITSVGADGGALLAITPVSLGTVVINAAGV